MPTAAKSFDITFNVSRTLKTRLNANKCMESECTTGSNILSKLPSEILMTIAEQLPLRRDALNLCLVSRLAFKSLYPVLYQRLDLYTMHRCKERLKFLLSHPEIAGHIRSLTLRPSHLRALSEEALEDEALVSKAVELLAPNLHGLQSFFWDGHEQPDDKIWSTLQKSCPNLKSIGTSIGSQPLDPESALFTFSDLTSFCMMPKRSTNELHHQYPRTVQQLPAGLVDMLINRCHKLAHLTLGGSDSPYWCQVFDGRSLTSGRWPHLQSLALGRIVMLVRESTQDGISAEEQAALSKAIFEGKDKDSTAFSQFLGYHMNWSLQCLTLSHAQHYPVQPLSSLKSGFPGRVRLEAFSGALSYAIRFMPYLKGLKELDLCAEKTSEWTLSFVREILRHMPCLHGLGVWLDMTPEEPLPEAIRQEIDHEDIGGDPVAATRLILECVSKLKSLKLICSTRAKYAFTMKALSGVLVGAPQLESLEVTKVYKRGEESMVRSAARFARALPNLQHIALRYASDPWTEDSRRMIRQGGIYDVVRVSDTLGIPSSSNEPVHIIRNDDMSIHPFSLSSIFHVDATETDSRSSISKASDHPIYPKGRPVGLWIDERGAGLFRMFSRRYRYKL